MKKIITLLCLMVVLCHQCALSGIANFKPPEKKIVTATKRINLPDYPGAYNPSIIKFNNTYLLTFRYQPNRFFQSWISYIGIVVLNEAFEIISEPQLIDTRLYFNLTLSQSEDARIFSFQDRLYLIYNDNVHLTYPSLNERRDMYIAELIWADDQFLLTEPTKLFHEADYDTVLWQKNWSPFEWNGNLLLSYSLNPHQVLSPDLSDGSCQKIYETSAQKASIWSYGTMRGGTPALLVDGEYLAFFHSGLFTSSVSSNKVDLWHYYMGAYTFSANPPFGLTKISSSPIDSPGFYTYSSYEKRVIYPGGFVVDGNNLYVAYGKDDNEIWIATMDLTQLKKSMVPIKTKDLTEK